MGKKILVSCLDVIMIAFFSREISGADYFGSWKYTVKDHISNTKLEKGDQTWHNDLCS